MLCKPLINDFLVTAYPQGLPNYKKGEAFRNKVSIDLRVVGSVVFSSVDVVVSDPLVWSGTVMVGVEDAEDCISDRVVGETLIICITED